MKVKCPNHKTKPKGEICSWVCGPFVGTCSTDIEIPTADLIAELEKRRPCERCEFKSGSMGRGCVCFWNIKDNFKPSKGEK